MELKQTKKANKTTKISVFLGFEQVHIRRLVYLVGKTDPSLNGFEPIAGNCQLIKLASASISEAVDLVLRLNKR